MGVWVCGCIAPLKFWQKGRPYYLKDFKYAFFICIEHLSVFVFIENFKIPEI